MVVFCGEIRLMMKSGMCIRPGMPELGPKVMKVEDGAQDMVLRCMEAPV